MKPSDFGLPDKFTDWRKGQEPAIRQMLYGKDRFTLLNIPVGGGKSLSYMAYAMAHEDSRVAVLTATRALQDQLSADFASSGLEDIRGRANYVCEIDERRTAADAKCTYGFCEYMNPDHPGCEFYDRYRTVQDARVMSSNYAFWLHAEQSGKLGQFSTLILDEAHQAASEIERFATVEISEGDLRACGLADNPTADIQQWGPRAISRLDDEIMKRKPIAGGHVQMNTGLWMRDANDLKRKIARLCRLSEHEWLYSRIGRRKWRWNLLAPGALAEELLFRGASRVILSSATVNKKTLEILGIDSRRVKTIQQESTFPVARRPIYYWPVARVGRGMDGLASRRLREAIDEVIASRRDRKGIIQSVSYKNAINIVRNSRFRDDGQFVLHTRDRKLDDVLSEWRQRDRGTLVSPAIGTGIDMPGVECEYNIIPKMPFPDMGDPFVKAKMKRDREYLPYVTLQNVVQYVGRGMRSKEDSCECVVLDAHFAWLKAGYWEYLPRWFQVAIKTLPSRERFPAPLPKL